MTSSVQRKLLRFIRRVFLVCLGVAILGGAAATARYLLSHPRRPEQAPPVQEIPVVEVAAVEAGSESVTVRAMGTVIPANEVTLQAEVSGRIVRLHPEFMEGGLVAAGETLVEIDPRDYELALAVSQTQVEQAEADLKVEQGQQEVAQHEWELLDMKDKASELDQELALRKPYLRQMRAAVDAAQAQARQARLNLERTKVKAPFNAIIKSADVRVGDVAGTQTQLASLIGTDTYWIQVGVAVDDLKWIEFAHEGGAAGSLARIASDSGGVREGRVLKLLSDLEEGGLLAQILIPVKDPVRLAADGNGPVPLLLGEVVTVAIEGRRLDDVFALPRTALREGADVWLVDAESRLAMVQPEVVWRGDEEVLCRGLAPGASIIVSDLAGPVEGMKLQVIDGEGGDAPPAPEEVGANGEKAR
ncbi:MAG: efflux RND transporter periplasmic adaptor subunit [Candidatus Hydrogenedentes bacterium]|nr:efflux RND transporter periplasmic adaptor subunit [Candidatus Hydrogenedentota bacterium]